MPRPWRVARCVDEARIEDRKGYAHTMGVALSARIRYIVRRFRAFRFSRVWGIATQIAEEQSVSRVRVFVDMLFSAAFRDTAYIDYYEADFALLNRAERATFMTSLLQHHLATALNDREAAKTLENKLSFNVAFSDLLHREWIDIRAAGVSGLREFAERHPVIIAKVPVSREGKGVFRFDTREVRDWSVFFDERVAAGQLLVEEPITQHPAIAAYCSGTVNTIRMTTWFDGAEVHLLVAVQKFGRGAVSDQFTWGGFYTMLDDDGASVGPGYTGKHKSRYDTHPDSGESIIDYRVPLWNEAVALVKDAARRIPEVPYVGWDVAITPEGPLLIEGNWIPGLYETRVSATGLRRGSRPRHEPLFEAARNR